MFNLNLEAQGPSSNFTFCHGHLKKPILLHIRATVRFHLNTAVQKAYFESTLEVKLIS